MSILKKIKNLFISEAKENVAKDSISDAIGNISLKKSASSNTASSNKEAYQDFARLITKDNINVESDLELFFTDKNTYFKKYEFDLMQRGIESPEDIPEVIPLVDALLREKSIVYLDWKTELIHALPMLDVLSDGILGRSKDYKEFLEKNRDGIIAILDEKSGQELFDIIKLTGQRLLCINEDSDSYVLFLVRVDQAEACIAAAKKANIRLYFAE